MYRALTAIFTFFQMRLEKRMSAGYIRGEVQTAIGRKRTQFLPAGHTRMGSLLVWSAHPVTR